MKCLFICLSANGSNNNQQKSLFFIQCRTAFPFGDVGKSLIFHEEKKQYSKLYNFHRLFIFHSAMWNNIYMSYLLNFLPTNDNKLYFALALWSAISGTSNISLSLSYKNSMTLFWFSDATRWDISINELLITWSNFWLRSNMKLKVFWQVLFWKMRWCLKSCYQFQFKQIAIVILY